MVHTFLSYSKKCDYSCGPIPWSFAQKKNTSVCKSTVRYPILSSLKSCISGNKKSTIKFVPWEDIGFTILAGNPENSQKNQKICKIYELEFFHIVWSKINSKYIFLFVMSSGIPPHVFLFRIFHLYKKTFFVTHS